MQLPQTILWRLFYCPYLFLAALHSGALPERSLLEAGGTTPHCCACFAWRRLVSLRSPGSRACGLHGLSSGGRGLFHTGSVGVRHGLSCPPTCRTFRDPGPSPRPRRWQVDSHLLRRQGSPTVLVLVPGCPRASVVCLTAPASGAARSNSTRL